MKTEKLIVEVSRTESGLYRVQVKGQDGYSDHTNLDQVKQQLLIILGE